MLTLRCIGKRSVIVLIALSGAALIAEVPITNADNSWLPVTGAERKSGSALGSAR
jgi:hypothetical protein